MALIDTISRQLRRIIPRSSTKTTSDELPRARGLTEWTSRFKAAKSRADVVKICREMYGTDPRAKGSIRKLATDATKGGFTLTVTAGARATEAQTVVDELLDRLKLLDRLDDYLRLSLRDGDTFLELSVDPSFLIQEVTRKPTLVHRG